jgi:hypothetical protein
VNPSTPGRRIAGMRTRLIVLLVAAAPFLLAGCGKGKY